MEEELRAAERLLSSLGVHRLDGPHSSSTVSDMRPKAAGPSPGPRPTSAVGVPTSEAPFDEREPSGPLLVWLLMTLSVTSGMFGTVLIGWSYLTGRAELGNLGLPFAVAGHALLMVALFLQLDRICHGQRTARSALRELDRGLRELRQSTELIGMTHSSPSQAFYHHLAEGASPQLLLSDVKGQLDMLANRLAQVSSGPQGHG